MNNTQHQLEQKFISHGLPYDQNFANAPDILAKGAGGIHETTFHSIELIEEKTAQLAQTQRGEAKAAWVYPTESGRGRAGLPMIIEPQRRDKHEFDATEHSERAAWAISQFYRTIYPKLPEDLQKNELIRNIACWSLEGDGIMGEWSLAAYLHDIEKFFESRKAMNPLDPSTKNEDSAAQRVGLLQTPTGKDYKTMDILTALFAGTQVPLDNAQYPVELQGLLHEQPVNARRVTSLYSVYKEVDRSIIEHAKAGLTHADPLAIDIAYGEIQQLQANTHLQIMGILLMAADNFAQGVPPVEAPPVEKPLTTPTEESLQAARKKADQFLAERQRNYDIVIKLLRKAIETSNLPTYQA